MINKESEILTLFSKEPWKKFTFTDIQKLTKKKSKSYLSKVLNNFTNKKILLQERIGRSLIYSLSMQFPKARLFAGFVLEGEGWNKKHIPYKDITKLMEKIPTKNYIFLIAGSYADNTQTGKSDIDTVIIVDDSIETKRVYAELKIIGELNIPRMHIYVFKNKEFIEMLTNKEANYGKEIIKKSILLYGGQVYLQLIQEAIENGFTSKNIY
ncbi:nucleotidyltransferase domain-containing protein [Candidatus Woesearchaeota archaeon]|nr:nucleotidyltransferase domain-containing protein [Candidatus Woesearchaeota archaeon]